MVDPCASTSLNSFTNKAKNRTISDMETSVMAATAST